MDLEILVENVLNAVTAGITIGCIYGQRISDIKPQFSDVDAPPRLTGGLCPRCSADNVPAKGRSGGIGSCDVGVQIEAHVFEPKVRDQVPGDVYEARSR